MNGRVVLFIRALRTTRECIEIRGVAFDFDCGFLVLAIFTKIKPFLVYISKPINRIHTSDSSFSSQQSGQIVVDKIRSIPGVIDTKTLTGIKF